MSLNRSSAEWWRAVRDRDFASTAFGSRTVTGTVGVSGTPTHSWPAHPIVKAVGIVIATVRRNSA